MPPSETARALEQAAHGLTYQSETDAPWVLVNWPQARGVPTPAGVRDAGHHKPDAPTAEQSVDEFFGPLVEEQDWFDDEEKAADQIARSAVREVLVAALDDWAALASSSQREWALRVARRADPNPWRDRLREPGAWVDGPALLQALLALLACQPATMAGLLALLDYVGQPEWLDEDEDRATILVPRQK